MHCFITGARVHISDSFIWDKTKIEDGCRLSNSIVCQDVRLHKNTRLLPTCSSSQSKPDVDYVLGRGVELGPDVEIQEPVLLTATAVEDDWGESSPGI